MADLRQRRRLGLLGAPVFRRLDGEGDWRYAPLDALPRYFQENIW
jgi:hypothetical protein